MSHDDKTHPGQFEFISRNLATVSLEFSSGFRGGWDVPFAVWHAPAGMDAAYPASQHATITCLRNRSVLARVDRAGKGLRGGAEPNAMIIYGGGYDRHYVCEDDASCDQIYLTQDLITDCGREVFGIERTEVRTDRLFVQDGFFRRAVEAYVQRGLDPLSPPTRLEMNARATLLGLHLVTVYSTSSKPTALKERGLGPSKLRIVLERIEANLDGELRVADLSNEVGLGVRQFFSAFQASLGTTPHAYLLERRMVRAQAMLGGKASLAEIALDCGFASQQHFSTAFRKFAGVSPGTWRRTQMGPADLRHASDRRPDHAWQSPRHPN